VKRVFAYKLKPTKPQEAALVGYLDATRHLYNAALEHRIAVYKATGRGPTAVEQQREIKDIRRLDGWEWLADLSFNPLKEAVIQLDKSYAAFFRRVRRGEKPGFPRFKSARRWSSFTFATYGDGIKLDGEARRLYLKGVGRVRIRLHRDLEGQPRVTTICRKADGWYAHITCDLGPAPELRTGPCTAIDVGLESFATFADGSKIANPRHGRRGHIGVTTAQRTVSRRRRGSTRRRKAVNGLARERQREARRRRDFHHKTARVLVDQFATIAVEDLQTANLVRRGGAYKRGLNRSIHDAGWRQFVDILSSKAEEAGCQVVKVDPRRTSQACSGCGSIVMKALSVRTHDCPDCGLVLDRDHNAALNIYQRAWAGSVVEAA
jgi:putative transposase